MGQNNVWVLTYSPESDVTNITLFDSKFNFLIICWCQNNSFYEFFWLLCKNIWRLVLFVDKAILQCCLDNIFWTTLCNPIVFYKFYHWYVLEESVKFSKFFLIVFGCYRVPRFSDRQSYSSLTTNVLLVVLWGGSTILFFFFLFLVIKW